MSKRNLTIREAKMLYARRSAIRRTANVLNRINWEPEVRNRIAELAERIRINKTQKGSQYWYCNTEEIKLLKKLVILK